MPNLFDVAVWSALIGSDVSDITQALLHGVRRHLSFETLLNIPIQEVNLLDPNSLGLLPRASHMENGTTMYWVQFYREDIKSEAYTLLPQGLYFKVGTSTKFQSFVWVYILCGFRAIVDLVTVNVVPLLPLAPCFTGVLPSVRALLTRLYRGSYALSRRLEGGTMVLQRALL
jgi:hypothetical protein